MKNFGRNGLELISFIQDEGESVHDIQYKGKSTDYVELNFGRKSAGVKYVSCVIQNSKFFMIEMKK